MTCFATRPACLAMMLALATGTAAARDLPRGSTPQPGASSSCAAFGPGFVKVAGSDTCVRIGGSVEVDSAIVATGGHHGTILGGPVR